MCLGILFGFGCSQPTVGTLVESLKATNGKHIVAIEQLDLTTREGLPSPEAMRNAKVIKRVQQPAQLEAFAKALSVANEGRPFANHPADLGRVVLRIMTASQTWFVYCDVLKTAGTKTCAVNAGKEGETNINHMEAYESKALPAWLNENQIEPR